MKVAPSNFVDCKIFISMGVNLGVNLLVNLQYARPRLNRNGLWTRIFGKIFGKNRRKIAKVEKNCKNFWENFPKKLQKIPKKL